MYDVISVGELLVDLGSTKPAANLGEVSAFEPHAGGSPANLAANLKMLGKSTALVACVGRDSFGELLSAYVTRLQLAGSYVTRHPDQLTTCVLVTRTTGTPDFEVYRGADAAISWDSLAAALAEGASVLHTTCFALSGLPARSHLLRAAAAFAKTGGTLSLDANYAYKVWPDRQRAQQVVRRWAKFGALIKVSEDDWARLYEQELTPANACELAATLMSAGALAVCCTFGAQGAVLLHRGGHCVVAAASVEVVDATGAGDSYWAGFLAAYCDGAGWEACLRVANEVAATKLRQVGPLSESFDYSAAMAGAGE